MEDGIIELDTDRAALFGFTSDRFDGYLWKEGDYIIVSFIVSLERGNFKQLVQAIQDNGYGVKIPTPMGRMQSIVRKAGYRQTEVVDAVSGLVEIWTLDPP